jgi:HD superfamily phosphohydrolase
MYWQVYLHKTVVAAEFLLINVLKRAKELISRGEQVYATPTLKIFLENNFLAEDFKNNIEIEGKDVLKWYTLLDDNDILISIKEWQNHEDPALSMLAESISNRKLLRTQLSEKPLSTRAKEKYLNKITKHIIPDKEMAKYFLMTGTITNNAYNKHDENIYVLYKDGSIKEINEASDINLSALSKTVTKYFVCYPKELDIY